MREPYVDITTIVGIESLFLPRARDPWAVFLAGSFADAFVFSDRVAFFLPIPEADAIPYTPELLQNLAAHDLETVRAHEYGVHETPRLLPDAASESLQGFDSWANASPRVFRDWLALHRTDHIKGQHANWIGPGNFYDFTTLVNSGEYGRIHLPRGVTDEEYQYAFDVALRYMLYGAMLPDNASYLPHPIRTRPRWPQMNEEDPIQTPIPFSFGPTIKAMSRHLDLDSYSALLLEARALVHERKLHLLGPGGIEKEELRELALALHLPPRLKRLGWNPQVLVTLLALGLGAVPGVGVPAAIASAFVTLGAQVWDRKTLPRAFSELGSKRWLSWALTYDLEKQTGISRSP
ncbi:hypothetical protein JW848_09080 [Candidatus Bipolaricaulota bacterium]|nr:hypothetical protein [Candidatus Bipolaricaulota bacterium]